jgi:hypothetical protein
LEKKALAGPSIATVTTCLHDKDVNQAEANAFSKELSYPSAVKTDLLLDRRKATFWLQLLRQVEFVPLQRFAIRFRRTQGIIDYLICA